MGTLIGILSRRWEGGLWIDLDERIVGSQNNRAGSQNMVVGGSRTIPEAQKLLKAPAARCAFIIYSHFLV